MYGTIARTRVRPENREALRKVFTSQAYERVEGFRHSYVLWEDGTDAMWLVAVFADRDGYERNAADPAQHERYLDYRALMEEDPAWHDGEIESL